MDLEIVTIGTELLLGFTLDSNAAEIAQAVAAVGARVAGHTTVGDAGPAIHEAVAGALRRSGFVITTGGLGPTKDDVTKRAIADIFDAPLELDEAYLERLRERFAAMGRGPMPETNRCQAEVPRGATVLPNRKGTAPGLWMEGPPGTAVLLPGVPFEMRALMRDEVVPRLEDRLQRSGGPLRVIRSRILRTTGIAESRLAEILGELEATLAPATLAYLPQIGGVDLRFTVWGQPPDRADRALERAISAARAHLGTCWYGADDDDLAAVVLELLCRDGLRLCVAESCTGGLVGSRLTAIPGSSAVFVGGVISYANESKIHDLGVPAELIEAHGAVSEVVAEAMVDGALRRFGADAGVAVTGIAGPSGGTLEKPVGTVCLSARVRNVRRTVSVRLPGGRDQIRGRAAQAALNLVRLAHGEAKAAGGP